MTAHPIGSVHLNGLVACTGCLWSTHDRVDPVGALKDHRAEHHPEDLRPTVPVLSRNPAGAVLGLALLLGCGYTAYLMWGAGGWWVLAAAPVVLMAAVGASMTVTAMTPAPRDHRGRRIP